MKGKITKYGSLEIQRRNKYIKVWCPYEKEMVCGDACALFGEPTEDFVSINHLKGCQVKGYTLPLCTRLLEFTEFIDERENDHE